MATKSIINTINITDKHFGRSFVEALENAKNAKRKSTELKLNCSEIKKENIKSFFEG